MYGLPQKSHIAFFFRWPLSIGFNNFLDSMIQRCELEEIFATPLFNPHVLASDIGPSFDVKKSLNSRDRTNIYSTLSLGFMELSHQLFSKRLRLRLRLRFIHMCLYTKSQKAGMNASIGYSTTQFMRFAIAIVLGWEKSWCEWTITVIQGCETGICGREFRIPPHTTCPTHSCCRCDNVSHRF